MRKEQDQENNQGGIVRTVVGLDGASLSNRLDMEPLAVQDELPGWLLDFDSDVADVPGAPIYMAALPFPGRAEGIRFTITEEDLGIVCESSFSSARMRVCEDMSADKRLFRGWDRPSADEPSNTRRSKSLDLPRLLARMISFLSSNTEIPVPSKDTFDSSL